MRAKDSLLQVVARACAIKASVVERDEREGGLRAVLNYGHTLGHAVETLAGYGTIKHGEAVAIGMAQMAKLSCLRGYSTQAERDTIVNLVVKFGLPTELPDFPVAEIQKNHRAR